MPLDSILIYTFLLIFVRAGAMLSSAPIFSGAGVPVPVRIGISGMIAMALAPVIRANVGQPPEEMLFFVGVFVREAVIGLMMGYLVMMLLSAAEMAGHYLDVQIGFSMINVLNPQTETMTTLLSGFKMHLAVILFLLLNGHHLLLGALAKSYELSGEIGLQAIPQLSAFFAAAVGQSLLIGIQIAAPVGATMLVVDMAMAAMSRAVPQMNVLMVAAPAKVIIGLMALAVGLPLLAWSIGYAIDALNSEYYGLFRAMK